MNSFFTILLETLKVDAGQMVEEGHDPDSLLAEIEAAEASGSVDRLVELQEDFRNRLSPVTFPYDEPNDWESISSSFPDPDSHAAFEGSEEELTDRILAAWQGRCVGCQLGKPLEGTYWPEKVKETLQFVGSWPLEDYVNPVPDGLDPQTLPDTDFFRHPFKSEWAKGRFSAVQPDDDIHYSLCGLSTLEKYGPEFTSEQAVDEIIYLTPYSMLFAAGKSAFRNRVFGMNPPETAVFRNPCRQSLGATIRCDPYGWSAPGNPALAARMAYKDARFSQTRNGVYAGIFFAVLMADTIAHGDPVRAVDTAALYVPPKSRFAEMVRFVKSSCEDEGDWEKVNAAIYDRYQEEAKKFNHSIPNAAIVLMSLLMGQGDFTKTVGISVMAGMDTDCNGATAGSIMGCALGTKGIPDHWTRPLNDIIETLLRGMPEVRITDVAARTGKLLHRGGRGGNLE